MRDFKHVTMVNKKKNFFLNVTTVEREEERQIQDVVTTKPHEIRYITVKCTVCLTQSSAVLNIIVLTAPYPSQKGKLGAKRARFNEQKSHRYPELPKSVFSGHG